MIKEGDKMEEYGVLKSRGHKGSVSYSVNDGCYHGKIVDISDLVTYEAEQSTSLYFTRRITDMNEKQKEIMHEICKVKISLLEKYYSWRLGSEP